MSVVAQPAGTVTLVFTDIEASTRLLAELGEAGYREALADHRVALRDAFARHGGYEVDNQGDSFFYAFTSAADGVAAARDAMAAIDGGPIRIRVGIHTGEPALDPPKYVGLDVHTAARIMAAGHGGQVVVSQSTRDLVADSFPLTDLGEHRLKDLSRGRRLFQLGAEEFPPLKTLHRTNLPVPATAFIGRTDEVGELDALLRDGVRVLTLTGPGGVGKTRLALQAAGEAADAYPDGVWWVPLASLQDPQLLLSSVAQALGVSEEPGRSLDETLVDAVSAGRTLLLLDNLEHLLPEAAPSLVALRDAGGTTVLVTSRERLRLAGEHVHPVGPLAAPDAAALFSARTAAQGVDAGAAAEIDELCLQLDNLPLAVELAAARAGLLGPAEMISRLGGRLDRLKGGLDADPRQQTLRNTIGWSYDLLDEGEQKLFARLAVFGSGATLDAVESICDADLDVVASLLDKSLIRRTGERVWMLGTIREFASERLDADPTAATLRDRHARYYLDLAEAADLDLARTGDRAVLERLDSERDNVRAAFDWVLEHDPPAALQLVAALWNYWWLRARFHEGCELLGAALERAPRDPTEARASALAGMGVLRWSRGDRGESFAWLDEALACARLVGAVRVETIALTCRSSDGALGREEQIRGGEEAASLARASGDRRLLAIVTGARGVHMIELGELDAGTALTEEAIRLSRGVGDDALAGFWLTNLGWIALQKEDPVDSRARLEESLALAHEIGDTRSIATNEVNLGWVELLDGDLERASSRFEEGALSARQLGMRSLAAEGLWGLAHVAAARDLREHAARIASAALVFGEPAGFHPGESIPFARHLDDARSLLGEESWQKAAADGAQLGFDAALALAR
jgi:predicted ATPase/class 3 adenylate cyclase